MNLLIWNCRGLGNPRIVQELLDLISRNKLSLVFLIVCKVKLAQVENIKRRLGFDKLFFVAGVNIGGGLCIFYIETLNVIPQFHELPHGQFQVEQSRIHFKSSIWGLRNVELQTSGTSMILISS